MKNQEIAAKFEAIAELMELLGEDPFRIVSYHKAARALEGLTEDIETVSREGRATEIAGIGKSTAEKIKEYLDTGKIIRFEELAAKLPPRLPELMALPGLGPKTAAKLWKEAGVTSIEELQQALAENRAKLEAIEGMGPKKVQQMAQSLAFVQQTGGRMRLNEAAQIAAELVEYLRKSCGELHIEVAGSLRRGRESIGDIDLLCEAPESRGPDIIAKFCHAPRAAKILAEGPTKGSVLLEGNVQADLRVVEPTSFGAAWMYFTGSKQHNIRLRSRAIKRKLKLNEYGLFRSTRRVAGAGEQEVYAKLDLPYIAPELREDAGEIEAAEENHLPELVELSQIKGDFQMHTQASDGLATIDEMIAACRNHGYHALAITDHSQSQHQANGMDPKRLAAHAKAIRKAASKFPDMLVLTSCEVDILKDGSLDFPADVLRELDFVLVSPHAALNMTGDSATQRLVRAIESGLVHCLGHPTGRLINGRPGMEIDIERVARAAAKHHVALEINADPARLDLRDTHVYAALAAGAKLMINTDAHSIHGLDNMHYGATIARRGWATPQDVINTWSLDKLKQWLARS